MWSKSDNTINVDNVALSSLIVHFHCLSFPSRQGIVFTSGCFYVFIPAAPLLVLIATDEDYCIVVETSGFHILSSTASVVTKRIKV